MFSLTLPGAAVGNCSGRRWGIGNQGLNAVAGCYRSHAVTAVARMEWLTGRYREWVMPTKAAIYKARIRLGSAVMVELFAEVAKPFAAPGGGGFYKEWRLVSVDGTTLDLTDTPANEKACGRPGTKTDLKSAFPQARVLGLVECGTRAVISAVVSGYNTSEHVPVDHHDPGSGHRPGRGLSRPEPPRV